MSACNQQRNNEDISDGLDNVEIYIKPVQTLIKPIRIFLAWKLWNMDEMNDSLALAPERWSQPDRVVKMHLLLECDLLSASIFRGCWCVWCVVSVHGDCCNNR
jgi:hypothetical protein